MSYEIIHVMDHYEAYDDNGNFLCSGDRRSETETEAEEVLARREV